MKDKRNARIYSIYHHIKKKETKDVYSKHYKILIWWWKKLKKTQMENYTMFLDWKNQYCQNDKAIYRLLLPKAIYRFNAISVKLSMAFFTDLRQKKNLKIFWRQKKNIEFTKQSWERKKELEESGSWLQTVLQSYHHQNSMVLAQK